MNALQKCGAGSRSTVGLKSDNGTDTMTQSHLIDADVTGPGEFQWKSSNFNSFTRPSSAGRACHPEEGVLSHLKETRST